MGYPREIEESRHAVLTFKQHAGGHVPTDT